MHTTSHPEDVPSLDSDGLLHVGHRWVAIPDAQMPVVALLVERYGRLVSREDLAAAYVDAGNSGHEASIRSLVSRVGRRLGRLGLELHAVRGRGVVLTSGGDGPTSV